LLEEAAADFRRVREIDPRSDPKLLENIERKLGKEGGGGEEGGEGEEEKGEVVEETSEARSEGADLFTHSSGNYNGHAPDGAKDPEGAAARRGSGTSAMRAPSGN